jgi:hypothetical protein
MVIFTNFDFLMPTTGAKAFFVPVKNHIEGLGLELYDATYLYSADNAFFSRLDGLIDMANLESHVLEPTDPAFLQCNHLPASQSRKSAVAVQKMQRSQLLLTLVRMSVRWFRSLQRHGNAQLRTSKRTPIRCQ